jgi:hydroxymethylglutaryl-CoA synthase
MAGICSYGGYVPRYRLERGLAYQVMGWINPANVANARGERSVANFDEDAVTMAVAAGVDALTGINRSTIDGVYFASTSMPYKERLNAGIVSAALGVNENVRAADFCSSIKAGTSALLSALEGVESERMNNVVVTSSDCRLGKPASAQELICGDAGAAFVVGRENVIAEFKGSYSTTHDFVDHYRGQFAKYDRQWEDRWIRDLGFAKLVPEAINGLLEKYQMQVTDFSKVIYPCHYSGARKKLNQKMGISSEQNQTNFQTEMGETGTPHALVMLAKTLEDAQPGDNILVLSFGSGCDALIFEVTDAIKNLPARKGISGHLAAKAALDNYSKYLVWRDILPVEVGLRAEEDLWTRWSALWRKNKFVLGLWGGKCNQCGTMQLPPQKVCVNPACNAADDYKYVRFSDKIGTIASYTGDNLAASYNPPAVYGAIEFNGGGKYYFDFTDCELNHLKTGQAVSMSFRRKYHDKSRDISGYFWKAVPINEEVSNG